MNDEEVAVELRRTIIHLARKFNVSATDEGLTPSQASTLGLISSRGPLPLSDVARIDNLNPTMVSRIVGVLESRGLIERRKDPDDQRAYVAVSTPEGEALHRRIRDQRVAGIVSATKTLDPAQRTSIRDALGSLEALAAAMP